MRAPRVCSVPGCGRVYRAKGLCNMHCGRVARTGSVRLAQGRRPGVVKGQVPSSLDERFWRNVDKSGDCGEWTASKNKRGYGTFAVYVEGKGWRPQIASRLSYELAHGPISPDLCVRHKCDNPSCVNPAHLELGTHLDNMRDMRERGRSATAENHSQARFTWEQIDLIRTRAAGGRSNASQARELGVSSSTIDNIVNGKTWKKTA